MITENDWRLARQHIVNAMIEVVVEDSVGNIIDILHGVCNGGNIDVNSGSSTRRTSSISISPSKQIYNINERSLVWIDKMIKINLGILDQRDLTSVHTRYIGTDYAYTYKGLRSWYTQGVYLYSNASATYDASTNILNIELTDLSARLDGTVNGQIGGAITAVYPAYDEDEVTGEPIHYNTIRGAIENTLFCGGLMPYWEAYHYTPEVVEGVYTIHLKLEEHTGSATLDEITETGTAESEDFERDFYAVKLRKQGNIVSLIAKDLCYYEEQTWQPGVVMDSFLIGYTAPHALIFGHEADHPEYTFIIDDVGEYYAMPHSNEPTYDWVGYRQKYPLWNMIPYDLEFSITCTIWDILSEIVDLYPNYDAAFDENGIFRVQLIPSEYTDVNDFEYSDYVDMVISESVSTDLSTIRNVCEVWGEAMDADWYAEDVNMTVQKNYFFSSNLKIDEHEGAFTTYTYSIELQKILRSAVLDKKTLTFAPTGEDFEETFGDIIVKRTGTSVQLIANANLYQEDEHGVHTHDWTYNEVIHTLTIDNTKASFDYFIQLKKDDPYAYHSYTIPLEGYKDYSVGTRFGCKFSVNCYTNQKLRINDLPLLEIIDYSTKEHLVADQFDLTKIHVFQITKMKVSDEYVDVCYYLGISQSHAIDVLTNGEEGEEVRWKDPDTGQVYYVKEYSKEYYQKFYNCTTVNMTELTDSPYVVQKIGNRIDVKNEGEFGNIRSDELARERAVYENWKNSRTTDTVSITTKLMPFVTPFMKTSYRKNGYDELKDYTIQSVSHDLDSGTTSITMYTFYPLYKRPEPGEDDMTYAIMGGFLNENLYGDQDE